MAKASFANLGLKVNQEVVTIKFNEKEIEVKQYLPINDKLELITRVINKAEDGNNFANPMKIRMYAALEAVYAYTNLNITEKQREDEIKLYDTIYSSGLFTAVLTAIPQEEWDELMRGLWDSVEQIYKYRNSVMGILDTINQDYSNLNFDITEMQKKLSDPDNMGFLKDVLTKLG